MNTVYFLLTKLLVIDTFGGVFLGIRGIRNLCLYHSAWNDEWGLRIGRLQISWGDDWSDE